MHSVFLGTEECMEQVVQAAITFLHVRIVKKAALVSIGPGGFCV